MRKWSARGEKTATSQLIDCLTQRKSTYPMEFRLTTIGRESDVGSWRKLRKPVKLGSANAPRQMVFVSATLALAIQHGATKGFISWALTFQIRGEQGHFVHFHRTADGIRPLVNFFSQRGQIFGSAHSS